MISSSKYWLTSKKTAHPIAVLKKLKRRFSDFFGRTPELFSMSHSPDPKSEDRIGELKAHSFYTPCVLGAGSCLLRSFPWVLRRVSEGSLLSHFSPVVVRRESYTDNMTQESDRHHCRCDYTCRRPCSWTMSDA